jgi:Uma2 family endonuclease
MTAIPKQRYTIEEYFELERGSAERYEYFDGEVVAMSGGSINHSLIASNIMVALGNRLRERACRVLTSDVRLKTPRAFPYRYPDVAVVCDKPEVETVQGIYQSIPSFREYLIVAQDSPRVTHYLRQGDGFWLRKDFEGMAVELSLASLDCTLPLAEIYRLVVFGESEF